jgi:cysteine desulfurase family protein (TIGR01976 family)
VAADVTDRFPGLADGWARFDGPAGTQAVDTAIDAMAGYLRDGRNANSHGLFAASAATDEMVAASRSAVADLVGGQAEGIVFGPNTTSLMFAFTRAIARSLEPGDEIVCTRLDHDANVTPWVMAAADVRAKVVFADFDVSTGRMSVDAVASCLSERTKWVAVTGASNAIGTIPDITAITAAAHERGARVLIDAVHLTPHRKIDVTAIGCDVLACSPYKWYGPHAGLLCARPDLLAELQPYKVRPADDAVPNRFETGTPSFEAIAATGAAARFLLELGMDAVAAHEAAIFEPLLDGLLEMAHVRVHGPSDMADRTPTVAFTVDGLTPDEVASRLAAARVAVWSGDYYAVEVMTALGLADKGGAVRAGVARYTTESDVARLLESVKNLH